MPRAALLGLHARIDRADPDSWEDPALAQTYGPRGAVYLFPRDAVVAFTRGLLPRDDRERGKTEAVADRVAAALRNGPLRPKQLAAIAPEFGGFGFHEVRWAARAARYLIRWDTSSILLIHNDDPPDPAHDEKARIDLAERFLRWHGPADAAAFAKWSGIGRQDAQETWDAVADVAAEIEETAASPCPAPEVVRLLPPNDAYLFLDHELIEPDLRRRELVYPRFGQPGVVLVDGRLHGTWQRKGRRFRIELWTDDTGDDGRERVLAEVATTEVPLGGEPQVELTVRA